MPMVTKHGLAWDAGAKCWRNADGKRICGAGPKRMKGPCRAMSLYKNLRCHYHGGPSPSGVASATYKHGRWSNAVSPQRGREYDDAKNDPELMDLTRPLAIMDGQVSEALKRRDKLDTPDYRRRALELYTDMADACPKPDEEHYDGDVQDKVDSLGALLMRGVSEDRARDEVAKRVEQFSKHNGDAWKIRLSAANAINQADLTAIMSGFVQVVLQEAPEECHGPILRRLSREVLGGRLALPTE